MSEAGERNKGDLLDDLGSALVGGHDIWGHMSEDDEAGYEYDGEVIRGKEHYRQAASRVVGLLIHKGLLTSQGLELMKAIDDGA